MTEAAITSAAWRRAVLKGGAAAIALLATVAGASAAFAATDQAQGDDKAQLGELVVTARHYVPTTEVSATKVAIPLVETPQSITVVTRDQINLLNIQNLQQAMRYSAGAVGENFGPDERYDWLTVRGFSPVEYVDGLQAPVGSVPNAGLDLWDAESVEILKGPAGVLYGQVPPGGIVNFTTRRPHADFSAELQGQYGSFDHKQIAGVIAGKLDANDTFEGSLTALWRDHDTQLNYAHSKRVLIAPSLTWNIAPSTHVTLLTYYQHDNATGGDGGFLPAAGTLFANPNGPIPVSFNPGEPGYNRFKRALYGVGYEFDHAFSDHVSFVQNLKYSVQDEHFNSIYGIGLEADNRTLDRSNFIFPEFIRTFAVDNRLQVKANTGSIEHLVLLGVDYRDVKYNTDFGFGAAPSIDIYNPVYGQPIPAATILHDFNHSDNQQTGIYAQDSLKLDHWRFTASVRNDWLSGDSSQSAFTYRVGLNYVFDSGLAPYIGYATSFQPTTGSTKAGVPFVPTSGRQVEGGVKFEPKFVPRDVRIFITVAGYDLVQNDIITPDPNPANPGFSVQTGQVEVSGAEFEAVARIHERLTINASYSYADPRVTRSNNGDQGKQMPDVPKYKGSLLVDYTQQTGPLAGLGLGAGIRYLGSSFGDPTNTLRAPAETLGDLIAHYDYRKWRLAVNVSNIADKVYVARCSSTVACYYSSRREVFVSLDHKW